MKNKLLILATVAAIFLSCQKQKHKDNRSEQNASSAKKSAENAFAKGDYFKALDHYYDALEHYRKINNTSQVSLVTSKIGNIYSQAGFHTMALNFYQNAFEQYEKIGEPQDIAALYYNIAKAMHHNEQNEKAKVYLSLADSIFNTLNLTAYKPQIIHQLGLIHLSDSNYISARKKFHLAIKSGHQQKGMVYTNIGYSHHLQGNNLQALDYYRQAMKYQKNMQHDTRNRLFQSIAQIHQNQDSVAWYYNQQFDKEPAWIDDLYLASTHTLYDYHFNKKSYDSSKYYHDLEHYAGIKLVKQRDELKKRFNFYQVRYAHYKEETRQQTLLAKTKQIQRLFTYGIAIAVFFLVVLAILSLRYRKEYRLYEKMVVKLRADVTGLRNRYERGIAYPVKKGYLS